MTAPSEITEILRGEKLDFSAQEDGGFWIVTFDVERRPRDVLLQHPEGGEYLIALSYIAAPFQGEPLDNLGAETLRKLVRIASEVPLAKLHYLPDDHRYLVTSECAMDGVNGRKLRRRLEACARLADLISIAFQTDGP
jgi:hypothetical protein